MKYVLVYLLKGDARKCQQKLVKEVGPRFGENYMMENPLPAHITLKSPFELRDIKELEKKLKEFTSKHRSREFKIRRFGNFRRFVAFLKPEMPQEIIKLQKKLLKTIKDMDGIELHEFDKKWKPHATIAYGNTKESFDNIWNYLKKLDKPNLDLVFDNITILKKPKKYWKVHKVFKLK